MSAAGRWWARGLWVANRSTRYTSSFGLRRGVPLALADRPGASGEFEMSWPGYPAPFRLRRGGSDLRTFEHVIVRDGYELPFSEVDVRVVIDAGANIGLTSAWFARRHPDAVVIAVEPDEANLALLRRNVAAYPNVIVEPSALWGRSASLALVDPGEGPWAYRTEERPTDSSDRAEVPAVDLAELCRRHSVEHVDVLKLDIEGAELDVLRGDLAWVRHVDVVVAELHDRFRSGCSRAFFAALADFTDEVWRDEDVFVRRPTALVRSQAPE